MGCYIATDVAKETAQFQTQVPRSMHTGRGGCHRTAIKYGYFRCPKCEKQWESSHVYVDIRTQEVHHQMCRKCRIPCVPSLVEPIRCSVCEKAVCTENHSAILPPHSCEDCPRCRYGYPCVDRCVKET